MRTKRVRKTRTPVAQVNFTLVGQPYGAPMPERLMLTTSKKDLPPSIEMTHAYQRLYDHFNTTLFQPIFGEPLPRCILNLSRRRGAVAMFLAKSWVDPMNQEVHSEISLVPEWTNRDPKDVLSSLVHEMAHYQDHLDGTDGKGGYHSKSWARIMYRLGLPEIVHGSGRTKVSHSITQGGPFDDAYRALPRDLLLPFVGKTYWTEKRPDTLSGKRAKYECPSCGLIMRGKSKASIICGDCDEKMGEVGIS